MKLFLLLISLFLINGCARNNRVAVSQPCTVSESEQIIKCPDGTSLKIPVGKDGADGTDGVDGVNGTNGTNGSVITVTNIDFPLVTTCNQLNTTTWAKRSGGSDIKLYALATCTGASSQDMTHTGNEIFWSGPRQFYIMDTLTTMKKIDF